MGETLKKRPQELTKAELEIMQVIWQKEKVLVHDVLAELPEPKPAYNTVSTIVRILENKGFVSHKAYGRTYEYFPIVAKEDYTNTYIHAYRPRQFLRGLDQPYGELLVVAEVNLS